MNRTVYCLYARAPAPTEGMKRLSDAISNPKKKAPPIWSNDFRNKHRRRA